MSLKLCCIASGSKGNCCYISDGTTNILIDLGISAYRAESCLAALGVNPDGARILVTHSHSDHIAGLKVFCKRHAGAKVICQKECATAVAEGGVAPLVAERELAIGGLCVSALPVSHDVPCFGYVVSDKTRRVAVVTDVGRLDVNLLEALSSCDIVMLEANHDVAKLNANPRYTYVLKQRILSARGHLSNADCASACAYLATNGVKNFILAHLSEENNTPELALGAVRSALFDAGIENARIATAKQDEMSGLYEIC